MNIQLTRACANCPFRKEGAIELREGRLRDIARGLLTDDRMPFLCHKTVYGKNADGVTVENEDGTSTYQPGHRDSVCAGSMVFLLRSQRPNVAMRMGAALGLLSYDKLRRHEDEILDPESVLGEPVEQVCNRDLATLRRSS